MLRDYLEAAKRGEPVWLGDLRRSFQALPENRRMLLRLIGLDGLSHEWELYVPEWHNEEEVAFVKEYLAACVFNLLSSFSGRELCFVYEESEEDIAAMIGEVEGLFQLDAAQRSGYGKVISISDRLCRAKDAEPFHFSTASFPQNRLPAAEEKECNNDLGDRLRTLTDAAKDKFCCGIDVGGTDIKAAVSLNGRLLFTREYDWNPASYKTAEEIIQPILLLARLLRLGSCCSPEELPPRNADLSQIEQAVLTGEALHRDSLRAFDSIGLSFPDVVIQDRILGGETPKTQGLRKKRQKTKKGCEM